MIIGVPKEIKTHEHRVGLMPHSIKELVQHGHSVLVQSSAGDDIGVSDKDYISVGAQIVATAAEVFARAELIIKVKEPQAQECAMLNSKHILFTFLHLAADKNLAHKLLATGVTAIAYETVTNSAGHLPILAPMSMIAGRVAVQRGAHYLEQPEGGRGILLSAIEGTIAAKVTIIGAGVVGSNALDVALGMGARVTILDKTIGRLQSLYNKYAPMYPNSLQTLTATNEALNAAVVDADLVIGAVLLPGAAAPKIVTQEIVEQMTAGSVIADVAIDQGGCFETSLPTNFKDPIYVEHGIIHQCITNLPSAVPRTSAFALNHVTLPYILELASKGYKKACLETPGLLAGLNLCSGVVTHESVAQAIGAEYTPAIDVLQA